MDRDLRIRMLFEAMDKVTGPLRNIAGGSSNAAKELKAARTELDRLKRAQADIGAFRAMKQEVAHTSARMKEAQARVHGLAREMSAAGTPSRKLSAEFARAQREARALKNEHQGQSLKLQQLRTAMSAAGISANNLASHERRLRTDTERANGALDKQKRRLAEIADRQQRMGAMRDLSGRMVSGGAGAMAAGVATGMPLAASAKDAMAFESAMADVRKVVDFPSPRAFAQMSNDLLDMSERIPMSADGLAQIVAAAGRANIARRELLGFAEDAAKMGVAFDTTAEEAGGMMAKWRVAFTLSQREVVSLADRINALTNSYGGNAAAVSEIVTRIGPLGKVAGATAPEIGAMGALMNSLGIESEIAATGIKNTMLALTKGEAATKSQGAALKALGLDAIQVSKDMQKNASATITDVMTRISKLPKEAQAGILTQLFGSESVAAIAPLLSNLDQLQKNFQMVGDKAAYAGSMQAEYLSRIATTEGAVGLAKNSLTALNITLGQQLLPTITRVSGFVGGVAKDFRKWAREHPVMAQGVMTFAAAISALLIVLGILGVALGAVAAGGAALGLAMAPLLAILAIVAALGTAVYLIYDNWGAISGWFSSLWDGIKSIFLATIDALINGFLRFTPLGLLMRAVLPAIAWLRGLNFAEIGRNLIQGLINGITGMLSALKSTITNAANNAANWFKSKLGIKSPSRVFMGIGGYVMQGLDRGIADGQGAPVDRMKSLAGRLAAAMALGSATPALASGGAAPPAAAGMAAGLAAGGNTYHITVQAGAGADGQDIARAIAAELDRRDREAAARQRSSYTD